MTKSISRTKYSFYNFASSMGGQVLTIAMKFIVRTVFIATLGKEYLGIGGLFQNILQLLSFAEFGVGSAIIFKLYSPIAQHDIRRINILMNFYKTIYRYVGIFVALIGLCMIPFLPYFIKDYDKLEYLNINIIPIFLLYLLNSVSSYLFFAYKSAIISANQKEYLLTLVSYIFTLGSGLIQIGVLYLTGNFELYVFVYVLSAILQNLVWALMANKMYPYIKQKCTEKLEKSEIKNIFKDCGALLIYRLNGIVLKATGTIILSVYFGLVTIAMYSNYFIFYTSINTLFSKIYNAIVHSLGNLHTTNNINHEYEVFRAVNLMTVILGATFGTGVCVVADELIDVWIGHDWILAQPFSILMGLEIYTLAIRIFIGKYRNSMGLFQQAKYRPLVGMIINLVVSVLFVKYWGVCGILVGTIVADWTTMMWYDPIIVHKYGYNSSFSVGTYFIRNFKYVTTAIVTAYLCYMICSNVFYGYGYWSVILHSAIVLFIVPTTIIVTNLRTIEGQYVINMIKNK